MNLKFPLSTITIVSVFLAGASPLIAHARASKGTGINSNMNKQGRQADTKHNMQTSASGQGNYENKVGAGSTSGLTNKTEQTGAGTENGLGNNQGNNSSNDRGNNRVNSDGVDSPAKSNQSSDPHPFGSNTMPNKSDPDTSDPDV